MHIVPASGQVRLLWNQRIVIACSLSHPAGHKPSTLHLYVSCDLTVTPCAGCIFLRVYLRPREVLHGPSFRVVSRVSYCLTDRSTVFYNTFVSSLW